MMGCDARKNISSEARAAMRSIHHHYRILRFPQRPPKTLEIFPILFLFFVDDLRESKCLNQVSFRPLLLSRPQPFFQHSPVSVLCLATTEGGGGEGKSRRYKTVWREEERIDDFLQNFARKREHLSGPKKTWQIRTLGKKSDIYFLRSSLDCGDDNNSRYGNWGSGKEKKDKERPWPQVKFVPGATVTPEDQTFFFFSRIGRRKKCGRKRNKKEKGKRRGRVTLSRRRESLSRKRSCPVNKRGINAAIWSLLFLRL